MTDQDDKFKDISDIILKISAAQRALDEVYAAVLFRDKTSFSLTSTLKRLFDRPVALRQQEIKPYLPVVKGVSFGFEGARNNSVILRQSLIQGNSISPEGYLFQISIEVPIEFKSNWLSIEADLEASDAGRRANIAWRGKNTVDEDVQLLLRSRNGEGHLDKHVGSLSLRQTNSISSTSIELPTDLTDGDKLIFLLPNRAPNYIEFEFIAALCGAQ